MDAFSVPPLRAQAFQVLVNATIKYTNQTFLKNQKKIKKKIKSHPVMLAQAFL